MGHLLQDISSVKPAPTFRRETAVMVASLLLVVPLGVLVFVFVDTSRVFNMTLIGLLLAWIIGRFIFVLTRGDVSPVTDRSFG